MLRKWIERIIKNALFKEFCDVQITLDLVRSEVIAAKEFSNRCEQRLAHLTDVISQQSEKEPELEPVPLAQSRPSWMRMKKHFEERDVRGLLDSQRAADQEFIGHRETREPHPQESERVANYWRNKQERS